MEQVSLVHVLRPLKPGPAHAAAIEVVGEGSLDDCLEGFGLIAFRTFGEIKLEARRIAEEHSKSEVELSLATVPDRVKKAVEQVVSERLPDAIDEAVENAGKAGRLDHALQKAIMQISSGGGATNTELQPDFETQTRKEENDA